MMDRLKYWVARTKQTAVAMLNPWREVRRLRDANERLAATIADPMLTGINIGNGTFSMGMEGLGPQLVAGMFLGLFEKYPDAKNYIEVTFGSRMGPILVTVMKPGGKTPHQLRSEAERQLAEHLNTPNVGGKAAPRAGRAEARITTGCSPACPWCSP